MTHARLALLLLLMSAPPACGGPDEAEDDAGALQDGPVVTEELGGGVYETVVDATAEAAWTYFDFESRAQAIPPEPGDDPTWDLGMLRFNVKTNGGTSGSGGAAVAIVEGVDFEAVTAVPTDGWKSDTATEPGVGGSPAANITPGYAFDNWFMYDLVMHVLMPAADRVHVVRTPEGNHYKVAMLGYYDEAGTPGFVRFRWAALPAG